MELFRGYKKNSTFASEIIHGIYAHEVSYAKLLQKSEMRKDIVIELSYKGFS